MVLDSLGSSLRNTLSKITGAMFVDEKLVNELVKDIQRALLQSDCNVKLVFELTKQIKETFIKDQPPAGMGKKEWLIKIVYDKLVEFLGSEESQIKIEDKKPFKIMLVGLFGNGKCVHKDSNILLSNGVTISAEKLYKKYKSNGEFKLEDGYIVPLSGELYVPSLNTVTLKMEKKKVSHLWKLNSKKLVNVTLDNGNGFNVKTTREHPFFILTDCIVEQKRADELKVGDYVAVPRNVVLDSDNSNDFENELKMMNLDLFIDNLDNLKTIKDMIKVKYGTLLKAVAALSYKRNYAKFTHSFKKGQVPVQFCSFSGKDSIKLKSSKSLDFISFPTRITPELAEFIGYIVGDGYLSKNSVNISNEDPEIIYRLGVLSKELFAKDISLTLDKRRKKLQHVRVNSASLVEILHKLFKIPIGKKGRSLEVPGIIQSASLDVVSRFLRAYFDCDAHFSPKQRQIEIVSESKVLLKQVHHMLLRLGIISAFIIKKINGAEYFRLLVQARSAVRFRGVIDSLIDRKQNALDSYELMTIKQGDGKTDMVPVGDLLRKLRMVSGFSLSQIQKYVSSYGLYEKKGLISRTQLKKVVSVYEDLDKANFSKLLKLVENREVNKLSDELNIGQPLVNSLVGELKRKHMLAEVTNSPTKLVLTDKGKKYFDVMGESSPELLSVLTTLANADVSWLKVKSVSKMANDSSYVYDLTVEDNHNFIADGIVVHNTTTAGKLAKFYSKRGVKVAMMSTDTWRPAAFEQLRQLGAQVNVPVFGNPKLKDPVEIYKSFEKELSKFDLVIIDTAGRDALSDDLIDELNGIHKAVNADEKLLVIAADVGQAAEKQAKAFHDTCGVTGVVITKLDGTAKGGGALIACSVTGAKVMFVGVGEKVDDFEKFKPQNFVGRMLGMGDIESLLEKAREAITEEDAQDMGKKFLSGKFNLVDLYEQMSAMRKMGPLGKVMEMIPGMGQLKLPKEMISVQEGKLKTWKFIMDSCTKEELEDPDVIDRSRIDRIAKGSGTSSGEIRELLKQYKQSKKMVKMFKGAGGGNPKSMEKMMKRMGGMKGMAGGMPGMKFK